jgi:hypothetical protein
MNELEKLKLSEKDLKHYNKISKLSKSDLEQRYMTQRQTSKAFILVLLMYLIALIVGILLVGYVNQKEITNNNKYIVEIGKDICKDEYLFSQKTEESLVIMCSNERHEYKIKGVENE